MGFGFPFNWRNRLKARGDLGIAPNVPLSYALHLQLSAAQAAAAAAAGVHAAITLPTTGTTLVTTGIVNPPYARNLSIVGNAVGITGNVVVSGTNTANQTISETLAANGTTPVIGAKAFKTVSAITVPARNAGGDTIAVGFGSKIGLSHRLKRNTVLWAFLNNAKEGTAPTVATSATALESNTVLLNSALDGHVVDVYFLLDDY